jgi:hypothetical protein
MQDEEFSPQPRLEALAPRFDALGLGDIAERLRQLAAPESRVEQGSTLSGLLAEQLKSILDQTS